MSVIISQLYGSIRNTCYNFAQEVKKRPKTTLAAILGLSTLAYCYQRNTNQATLNPESDNLNLGIDIDAVLGEVSRCNSKDPSCSNLNGTGFASLNQAIEQNSITQFEAAHKKGLFEKLPLSVLNTILMKASEKSSAQMVNKLIQIHPNKNDIPFLELLDVAQPKIIDILDNHTLFEIAYKKHVAPSSYLGRFIPSHVDTRHKYLDKFIDKNPKWVELFFNECEEKKYVVPQQLHPHLAIDLYQKARENRLYKVSSAIIDSDFFEDSFHYYIKPPFGIFPRSFENVVSSLPTLRAKYLHKLIDFYSTGVKDYLDYTKLKYYLDYCIKNNLSITSELYKKDALKLLFTSILDEKPDIAEQMFVLLDPSPEETVSMLGAVISHLKNKPYSSKVASSLSKITASKSFEELVLFDLINGNSYWDTSKTQLREKLETILEAHPQIADPVYSKLIETDTFLSSSLYNIPTLSVTWDKKSRLGEIFRTRFKDLLNKNNLDENGFRRLIDSLKPETHLKKITYDKFQKAFPDAAESKPSWL